MTVMAYGKKTFEPDNIDTLKSMLRDGKVEGTIVIHGEEDYLKLHYANQILDAVVPPEARSFDYTEFMNDFNADALMDLSMALPMGSDKRLIMIRDIDIPKLKENEINAITGTVSTLPAECVLVFLFVAPADLSTAKARKLCAGALTVRCDKASPSTLENWASKLLADKGRKISRSVAAKLVEACNCDMFTIKNETDRLAALTDSDVTEDMLTAMSIVSVEDDAFRLAESMATGDYTSAYRMLSEMEFKKAKPTDIMGAVCSVFADMYRVSVAVNTGHRSMDIADYYGYAGKDFVLKRAYHRINGRPAEFFRKAVEACAETDRQIKTQFHDMGAVYVLIGRIAALEKGEL